MKRQYTSHMIFIHEQVHRREFRRSTFSVATMFPPTCVRAHAHTGRETRARKKTWSAHLMFPPKMFLHIFHTRHSKLR